MILVLDILKCIKYTWPTETQFQKSFNFSCQSEKSLRHSFNGAIWVILALNVCSSLFLLLLVAATRARSSSLSGGHLEVAPRDMVASELDLSCPFDPSRQKEVLLRTLFKSHLNPEVPEICKECLDQVSARLVSPSWATHLSSVRMWGMLFPVCKSTLLKSSQKCSQKKVTVIALRAPELWPPLPCGRLVCGACHTSHSPGPHASSPGPSAPVTPQQGWSPPPHSSGCGLHETGLQPSWCFLACPWAWLIAVDLPRCVNSWFPRILSLAVSWQIHSKTEHLASSPLCDKMLKYHLF